jgi:diacylglycerol kinase family enzyme
VRRAAPAPIQVDGELVAASADVEVAVVPGALKVLAPSGREEG